MRRYLFCVLFLLLGYLSNAQGFLSYLKDNIDKLDPIEGQYDVEETIIASVSGYGSQKRTHNMTWYIVKNNGHVSSRSEEFVVADNDGNFIALIDRIGETVIYTITRPTSLKSEKKIRFQLNSLYSFSISESDITMEKSVQGTRKSTVSAIKAYPTKSMYEESTSRTAKKGSNDSIGISPVDNSWSGSGFALRDGYVVTNYHVVDEAKSIIVRGVNGDLTSDLTAKVVASDKTNDLAIIRITDARFSGFGPIPYAIKSQLVDVGEDVWVLGYPLTQVLGNEIKLTTGVISSRSGYQGDLSTYQISAPVQPGNSGGPLFDSNGNVVGIVNAGVSAADNVGYAIKASYLKNLVDSYSLTSIFPTENTISSIALKDQVKKVSNHVFLLICSSKATPNSYSPSVSTHSSVSSPSSTESSNSHQSRSDGIQVNGTLQLSVPGRTVLEWSSNDPAIASVDSKGLLTGNKAGKTSIWAKLSNDEYEHFSITVWDNQSSTGSSNSPAHKSNQPSSNNTDIRVNAFTESAGGANESVVVSGTVRSSRNNALVIGVRVTVSGTDISTKTDTNGHYSIRAHTGDTLVFSEKHYESFKTKVGTEKTINVTMKRLY